MTRGLVIVKPLEITAAMVATDVPEADYSAWGATSIYLAGERVIKDHKVYEATADPVAVVLTVGYFDPGGVNPTQFSISTVSTPAMAADTPIRVSNSGGALPAGMSGSTTYYVQPFLNTVGTQYFYLSTSPGGSGMANTDGGTGTQYLLPAVNYGKDPTDVANQPGFWLEVGPTNRWALFDGRVSSQTAKATSMYYEITPGTAVGLIYIDNVVDAISVRVRVTDPDYGVAFDETYSLAPTPASSGWWNWFFGERHAPLGLTVQGLPSLPNATIRLDFAGFADLAVGVVAIGQPNRWGTDFGVKQGAGTGIQDYSRKETDQFGTVNLVERAFAKKTRWDVVIAASEVDSLQNFLASIRATPAVFVGANRIQSFAVFGFYKNFEIVVNFATRAECQLELEGLT